MKSDQSSTLARDHIEDGYLRYYDTAKIKEDSAGINVLENYMLHALDTKANYWGLWTESDNLAHYNEKYPRGFERLRTNLGYRLRPAWVWQRKRYGTNEVVVCVSNRGVAGVPGVLWLQIDSPDKQVQHARRAGCRTSLWRSTSRSFILLPKGYLGKVNLSAQLEIRPGVKKPIAWACEQSVNDDGSITIELKSENDHGWRKGV